MGDNMLKKILSVISASVIMMSAVNVSAETISEEYSRSYVLMEAETHTVIRENNGDKRVKMGSFNKLMTVLLAAEAMDRGELSLETELVTSEHANSMQGAQIWLMPGEKMALGDLLKGVIIGNANDACCVIAEKISGSEEKFTELMNSRAKMLGMNGTVYTDCTGMGEGNVTTAKDTALLCSELAKYKNLTPYLTCWLDTVRDGKAELVNLNRLVRTYKGVTGMKAWGSEKAGSCIAATAEKGDMSVCVVLNGCDSQENMNAEAKKLLNLAFDTYEIYTPELPEDMVKKTVVCGGEELSVELAPEGLYPIVIPRGTNRMVECDFTAEEKLDAPVKNGETAGEIRYTMGGEVILEGKIVACKEVKKMNFICGIKKLVYNLLSM